MERIRSVLNQLALNANDAQKRKYLPKLISANMWARSPCPSPAPVPTGLHAAQGDPARRPVRARRRKMWITNGRKRGPVVYAKTNPEAGARGTAHSSSKRISKDSRRAQKLDKLGMRGSSTSELVFDGCEVPAETSSERRSRLAS